MARRRHKSSQKISRETTNEHRAPVRRARQSGPIPPKHLERRGAGHSKADPEDAYGSGKRAKRHETEQTRIDDYEEPPFHNNYDDYDRTYPPSQRW